MVIVVKMNALASMNTIAEMVIIQPLNTVSSLRSLGLRVVSERNIASTTRHRAMSATASTVIWEIMPSGVMSRYSMIAESFWPPNWAVMLTMMKPLATADRAMQAPTIMPVRLPPLGSLRKANLNSKPERRPISVSIPNVFIGVMTLFS